MVVDEHAAAVLSLVAKECARFDAILRGLDVDRTVAKRGTIVLECTVPRCFEGIDAYHFLLFSNVTSCMLTLPWQRGSRTATPMEPTGFFVWRNVMPDRRSALFARDRGRHLAVSMRPVTLSPSENLHPTMTTFLSVKLPLLQSIRSHTISEQ